MHTREDITDNPKPKKERLSAAMRQGAYLLQRIFAVE
jgi:hypothetical protein